MMKAVFLDYASLDQQDLDSRVLYETFEDLVLYPATSPDQIIMHIAQADVVITNKVVIDADVLKQCPNIKLILITATGTNNVDLNAASQQGIVVCNCQGYGTATVAQHTMTLILALSTSLLKYHQAVQQGRWNTASQFCLLDYPITELAGKTLGIVGYGALGQAVAKLAEAFGMQVLVASLPHHGYASGRVPFTELISKVDVLSLHCPLTEQTKNLVNKEILMTMKSTAILINCARGGVVNEHDLAWALKNGQIAGAATDVLTIEPPKDGNTLLDASIPNLIITPHSAWGSKEARQRILNQTAENAEQFNIGKPIRQVNCLN